MQQWCFILCFYSLCSPAYLDFNELLRKLSPAESVLLVFMVIMETLSFPQSDMKDKFISWGHYFQPSTDNWTQVSDALWVEHIHQKMKCVPAWASLFSLPPLCRGSADEKGFWFLAFDCVFCRNTRSQRSRVISQCLFTRRLCFTLPSCLLYYDFFLFPKHQRNDIYEEPHYKLSLPSFETNQQKKKTLHRS